MKRNKNQDWTRVLQERLQDAQLPAPDDFASWAGQESPAFPARSPKIRGDRPENSGRFWPVAWWPWALATVAAAAVAGILFLRTPDSHSRLNPSIPPVVTESPVPIPAASSKPALNEDRQQKTDVPSSNQAAFEDKQQEIDGLSSKQAQNEDETPAPASSFAGSTGESPAASPAASSKPALNEDRQQKTDVPSSNQAAFEDKQQEIDGLTGESPARRPRVALRLHAASVSSTGQQSSVNLSEIGGQPVYSSPGANTPKPAPAPRAPTIPVSFGVSAELSLSRHWSLVAGLDYTQRSGYRVYENAPQSLTLHYLGIPLEAHYVFWPESRFRVYLGAGVKAEKSFLVTGGEPLKDPFLFSLNVQAGADVRILPGIRLYLSPVFSGYLTRSAYANTWDSKPQFSLRAGLSFDL
jgi:hypothetical protein